MENLEVDVTRLKNLITSASTDLRIELEHEEEYTTLRRKIINNASLVPSIPNYIKTCSNLKEVRREMQDIATGYKERRNFIKESFLPIFEIFYGKQQSNGDTELNKEKIKTTIMSLGNVNTPSPTKPKKIFISHASKDAGIVEHLIYLLEAVGVPSPQIFCTSFEGYAIKLGNNFLETIKNELNNDVLVLFVLTKNFYASPVSLCEMGATWVKTNEHIPVLIPLFGFEDIKGVIPNTQGMKINDKPKVNSLKDKIEEFLSLSPGNYNIWERKRDRILDDINLIIAKASQSSLASELPHTPTEEEKKK